MFALGRSRQSKQHQNDRHARSCITPDETQSISVRERNVYNNNKRLSSSFGVGRQQLPTMIYA